MHDDDRPEPVRCEADTKYGVCQGPLRADGTSPYVLQHEGVDA